MIEPGTLLIYVAQLLTYMPPIREISAQREIGYSKGLRGFSQRIPKILG
jgi:hypothetical protein